MPEETIHLQLPYILSSQAQKHITHNEALDRLDALVHLVIQSVEDTPPESPDEGDCYAVSAAPTGAWTGKAGLIASFQGGAWAFATPRSGWIAWFTGELCQMIWTGSAWQRLNEINDTTFPMLGINAEADTTNRLSVCADASLFNHDGGSHRMKINKETAADTASLLFQTGFSGRAEMGLAGNDDFEIKVSADGAIWNTAIRATSSGAVLFPARPLVRATYGETSLTPSDGSLTGFATLSLEQGGFSLGAVVPSGSGSRLVVPASGIYLITANVSSTASAAYGVSAVKNGVTAVLTVRDSDASSASYSQSATALAYFDAGDWLALSHSGSAEFQFGYGKTEILMALM